MRLRFLVPLLVSVLVVSLAASVRHHRTESVESAEAELSSSYLKSVAALADKRTFESILEADGAELLGREWDEFRFDLRRMPRLSSWELNGKGKFRVKASGADFSGEMEMSQDVRADKAGFEAHSRLSRPSGFVKRYETTVSVTNDSPPVLRVESKVVYERKIPFWMADDVDSRVLDHNKRRVACIVSIVISVAGGK